MRKFWDKNHQHKTLIITSALFGLVALIIIIIAIVFAFRTKAADPIILDVGGTTIHKIEYDELVNQGKKYKIPAEDVRSIIIDYYKNKTAADELNVKVDPKYPQLARGQMITSTLRNEQKKYDFESLSASNDQLAKMMIYNASFNMRMQSIEQGGYSVVVFDFPTALNPYEEKKTQEERTKKDAEELRKKVVSGDIVGDKAVKEAARINGAAGRVALTGYYFVNDNPSNTSGVSGTGIQTYGFLAKYMKTLKKEGVSEVSVTQGNDYFFVDYLSHDKANPDIDNQVTTIKNKVRVVEYDK